MHRRVLYRGKPVLQESTPHELMPGRWVLDSFIALPEDAEPGLYAMDISFRSRHGHLNDRVDFVVKGP